MRRRCGILWIAAAMAALAGCSSTEVAKKEEPKKEAPKAETAPDVFKLNFDTSKGLVVIEMHRDWAPIGVDHLYSLVKLGFYDNCYFFRYVRNFIVQFGINGDPRLNSRWNVINLLDDPVKPGNSNLRGTLTYATAGPRTRSTQLFINLRDNRDLDKQGFTALGKVIQGMDVVTKLYSGYGEMAPDGQGPDSQKIESLGNQYLLDHFPRLDYIKKATIE